MPRPFEFIAAEQPVVDPKNRYVMTRPWYMWLMGVLETLTTAGDLFGPGSSGNNEIVLFDGTSGTQLKAATGTGVVHATSGVYSASDVTLAEIVPATAASRLIGRRSGSAGDWEEVSLGAGLTMSASAVLDASAAATADHVVMSDGAQPPTPMDDGAGNFLYVAYTP